MVIRAESKRVMRSLFQAGEGGSIPTSALQLTVEKIEPDVAFSLNAEWHSRLPRLGVGNQTPNGIGYPCFGAVFDGSIYAVAIWSNPIARMLPQRKWMELRRFAIAPDAPRNTASRMLAVMARLIRAQKPLVERLISYQDTEVHTGCIYRAAGWTPIETNGCRDWSCSRGRPASQSNAKKIRWEKSIHPCRS